MGERLNWHPVSYPVNGGDSRVPAYRDLARAWITLGWEWRQDDAPHKPWQEHMRQIAVELLAPDP